MTSKGEVKEGDINIEELDALAIDYVPHTKYWTKKEIAIMDKYYGKVPIDSLMKYIPNRTKSAIEHKANEMGLKGR